ncbi:spore coat protein [Salinibacillus xinjiangensis]|uniref:Spore coat protein n=1 Tax=Salinibacillus xinjiangensis TaxID=1229268 RepID=A0A6G1X8H2_9BACI|nr:spore coat protein [Salinibacillus xinjiangensis]MRG87303.1 spore coat protein [Salinibacillus xinjiangensis]
MDHQGTLAWHESLELHELVAFKSIGVMKMKMALPQITDKTLKGLYSRAIHENQDDLRELMEFYQHVPNPDYREGEERNPNVFFEGDLLAFTKSGVRNYAVAITETATPALKNVLVNQLNSCIILHDLVYQYMHKKGDYPSYDLNKLFANDIKLAQMALSM